MKYFGILIVLAILLSACDSELNYVYSVENAGTNIIQVNSISEFEALDSMVQTVILAPGEKAEVAEYQFIGSTDDIESEPIYIELLEITNQNSFDYNKDPFDASLWEKVAQDKNNGTFLLKVTDEDFL